MHGANLVLSIASSHNSAEAQKKMTEQEEEEYDDPALDPENDYCSCGNMTDNYPVICDHCRYMARMD